MIIKFDTAHATVLFGSHYLVGADTSVNDLEGMGVKFVRDFVMDTGWILKVAAPLLLEGKRLNWTFAFNGEKLHWVRFGLGAEATFDAEKLRLQYNLLLAEQLGASAETRGAAVFYRYPWGVISSSIDPHNQTSGMTIKWN